MAMDHYSQKIYGERSGHTRPRTSLIAAKKGKKLLAPVLFQGSTNSIWFNEWLKNNLFPELKIKSTLILDNAPFHKKKEIMDIAKQGGDDVLFLPPYSPDFNKIEQDFAILKKQRIYASSDVTLDDLVRLYGT